MEKWLSEGGKEALASAKKKNKATKTAEKKAAATSNNDSPTKTDPKGGSGVGFKSKEFIEDSDSSSDDWNFLLYFRKVTAYFATLSIALITQNIE